MGTSNNEQYSPAFEELTLSSSEAEDLTTKEVSLNVFVICDKQDSFIIKPIV